MPSDHLAALLQPLRDLERWLKSSKIPHAIVGGVAATLQGEARATVDIDAVVMIPEEDWDKFLREGKNFGFTPRRTNSLAFAKRSRVLLLVHPSGVEIDISLGAISFEQEMIARAVRVKMGNVEIPLATPEDLIVMKALAMRPNDITDIVSLIEANEQIDLKRVRRCVRQMAESLESPDIADRLEQLLSTIRRSPSRKKKRRRKP